jgi:nicotinamide riboside kinase
MLRTNARGYGMLSIVLWSFSTVFSRQAVIHAAACSGTRPHVIFNSSLSDNGITNQVRLIQLTPTPQDMPPFLTEIYIIGPSSTGKTTLCSALARRFGLNGPAHITEVARDVMRRRGYTRGDVGKLEMQAAIMETQLSRERHGRDTAARSGQVLVSDRSGIDPIIYALLNAENEADRHRRLESLTSSPQFQLALSAYRRSVVVLLAPVSEWVVDDGVRSLENQVSTVMIEVLTPHFDSMQVQCLAVFKEVLSMLRIPYRQIGSEMKGLADRVTMVTEMGQIQI